MKKAIILTCYYLGLWGIMGFLFTLVLGFISYNFGFSEKIFLGILVAFAVTGVTISLICMKRDCKCLDDISE